MDDIILSRALRSQGLDSHEIRRMRQRGGLPAQCGAGAYVEDRPDDQTVEAGHRELIFATVPQLDDGAIVSHASAAVLHGLPTWTTAVARVHVTRGDRSGGGRRRFGGPRQRSTDAAGGPDDHRRSRPSRHVARTRPRPRPEPAHGTGGARPAIMRWP